MSSKYYYKDFVELQKKVGGHIQKLNDGTYRLINSRNGNYYSDGVRIYNGKRYNYDLKNILNDVYIARHNNQKHIINTKYSSNPNPIFQLQDKIGGELIRFDDGYALDVDDKRYYMDNNGKGRVKTPEGMRDYDINTGKIASYTTTQNPSEDDKEKDSPKDSSLKQETTKPVVRTQTTKPVVRTPTYTPTANATGAYTLGGWSTNEWGGGKKGILDASIASKLGLKEGATARDAQDFLISKGYGITPDDYWGKQSQAALDDYLNRQNIKVSTVDTPTLQIDPETKEYSYDSSFEVTPQQLKTAGTFSGIKNQNQRIDFNKLFSVKGHHDHQAAIPLRTNFGKQYDSLYNTLNKDQRDNIIWVQSGNTQIPIYQAPDGTYYKIGENGKLVNTGTYTLGQDGTYSVSFKKGGQIVNSINKYQQGGNMANNKEIQEFQKYIVAEAQSQNKDPETYIKELGEDGLKEAYKRYQTYKKKQAQKAAHGAKLQYLKSLKNKCAEDEELVYYKKGGNIDCGCVKKAQQGEKITKPANVVEAFKCGQKIKKNQQGKKFPLIETDKNGKNKTVYYNDEATRDSIAVNRYNDQEGQTMKPGSWKENAKGKVQWTPDRTKAPYNKKVTKHQQGGVISISI